METLRCSEGWTTRPLSPYEASFWGFERLGGAAANIVPILLRHAGVIDHHRLARALRDCFDRHPGLRSFLPDSSQGRMATAPPLGCPLESLDYRHLPHALARREADRAVALRSAQPFDLTLPPLARACVIQVSDQEALVLLAAHHIVLDGWSAEILLDDLIRTYDGGGAEEPLASSDDYAAWAQQWLTPSRGRTLYDHWHRSLAGRPPPTVFDDGGDPDAGDDDGNLKSWMSPDAESWAKIRARARECGLTPSMWVTCLFAVLAYRHTGSEELLFGLPLALRPETRFHRTVGCLTTCFPLRLRYSPEQTLRELGRHVKAATIGSLRHGDAPLDLIHRAAGANAGLDPVFQVMLNVLSYPRPGTLRDGWRVEVPPLAGSRFNATFYVDMQGGRLRIALSHDRARLSNAYGQALVRQFGALLENALERPERRLKELATSAEIEQQHRHRLALPMVPDPLPSVIEQIWRQAAAQPHAIAVEADGTLWTYESLIEASTLVAHCVLRVLRAASAIAPIEGTAAIEGRRGFGMIVAILGAWRAGLAILLLDPGHPPARRRSMLGQVRPELTIRLDEPDEPAMAAVGNDKGDEDGPCLAICRRTARPRAAGTPLPQGLPPFPEERDAAYVVFTSGTSGEPKALTGDHLGLSDFVDWQRLQFAIGPGDRAAHITGPSFDVVLREIAMPLVAGAALVVPTPSDLDPRRTLSWLEKARISVAHLVPSLLRHWLVLAEPLIRLPSLRLSFFAGEPLTADLATTWRARLADDARVINLYGPSETTLAKSFYVLPTRVRPGEQPVGTPLPGTQIWVEADGRCADIGEIGEVVIRTPYRTRGYLDPARTAHCFRANSLRPQDYSDRLYYTGDFGRHLPGGILQLRGRRDGQVKINGVRIELDGIDNTIRATGLVSNVATVHLRRPAFEGLVAYVVADERSLAVLSERLTSLLPAATRPRVCRVATLPLTANGKLDRAALPDPLADRPPPPSAPEVMSALEREVAEIISRHLGRPIAVTENFFDAGFTSLALIAVYADLSAATGHPFDIADPLRHPTVRALCRHWSAAATGSTLVSRDRQPMRQSATRRKAARAQLAASASDGP
jgi:amino acid adenylation domain-containing protein